MRLGEVAELLQSGQLVPDGGRADLQPGNGGERLAPHRLTGPDVLANQCVEDGRLPIGELPHVSSLALWACDC